MPYDRLTRWLHVGLGLGIPLQLLSEAFMKHKATIIEHGVPRARTAMETNFFAMHEAIGIALFFLIVLHILWSITRAGGGLGRLFPYFSTGGSTALIEELKQVPGWLSGKLHETAEESMLAGAVHGLGLLLVLGMGLTGITIFFGMDEASGNITGVTHDIAEVHEALGSLIWVYLIGHVSMVVLHRIKGHDLLSRISPLAK
ncbi:MAG: cytochrome b/b6 domain-containing protein [Gammaproteobacteria bacterium]|nr:cytochrome b/b6 domain-containing protein [Gammaproteobacteria bacterium]MCB1881172.1 cytochrome b/b6 domain-containing protein [Gammaproteobacteria bacterium]